jgi:glycerophosphoryl diester phosphodiesterase
VWTVNQQEDIRRLFKWGVNGIITDDPQLAVKVRNEKG